MFIRRRGDHLSELSELPASRRMLYLTALSVFAIVCVALLALARPAYPQTAEEGQSPAAPPVESLQEEMLAEEPPPPSMESDEIRVERGSNEGGSEADPTLSAQSLAGTGNGRIAFSRSGGISLINPDGSVMTDVTRGLDLVGEYQPAVSPDGSKIAFVGYPDYDNGDVYVVDADGSSASLTRVTETPNLEENTPDWSPDGTKLVYASLDYDDETYDQISKIFVKNANGTGAETEITGPSENGFDPSWAPGSVGKIAYTGYSTAEDDPDFSLDIFTKKADGTGAAQNVIDSPDTERFPDWSPDGTELAYFAYEDVPYSELTAEIRVENADGTGATRNIAVDGRLDTIHFPSWSPDGTKIAYGGQSYSRGSSNIFVANSDGTGTAANITNNQSSIYGASRPYWSTIPLADPPPPGSPDVSVSKRAPRSATANSPFEYSISVGNNDPNSTATNVVIEDTLPDGLDFDPSQEDLENTGCSYEEATRKLTCQVGDLWPDDYAYYRFSVTPTVAETTLENTATVTSDDDPDDSNDSSTTQTRVYPAPKTITSTEGPLSEISVSSRLNCQLKHEDDADEAPYNGAFYPGNLPSADCGTFIAVGDELFGPETDQGPHQVTPYTPSSQSDVRGAGTGAEPYEIETVVELGSTGLTLTQTDSYVEGEDSYATDVEIEDASGSEQDAIIYRAGDCHLDPEGTFGSFDFGGYDGSTGAVRCISRDYDYATDNNVPGDRILEMTPTSSGSNYYVGQVYEMWYAISVRQPLPNTASPDVELQGLGLSWNVDVPANGSQTRSSEIRLSGGNTVPPTISLASASDSGATDDITNDATPTFEGTADPYSFIRLFDGADSLGTTTADENGEWSFTATATFSDGGHDITAEATYIYTNGSSETSSTLTVTIDTEPPPVEITNGPSGTVGQTSATLDFTSDDSGASIACKLDSGGDFEACADSKSYENLSDAEHTFTVRAKDLAGNSNTDTRVWTVDTTPPAAPTVSLDPSSDSGATDGITNDATPTFTGTAEAGSTVRLFDGATSLGTATADGSGSFTATGTFSDGESSITAIATDAAGNESPASDALTVVIDTAAPAVEVTDGPPEFDGNDPGSATTSSGSASLVFSSESGAALRCKLDRPGENGAFAACSSPASFSGLANGTHTFTAEATDVAGNSGEDARVWKIAPDTVPATTTNPGGTTSSGNTVSEDDPASTGVTTPQGGNVSITESPVVTTPQTVGLTLLGQQIEITAPQATETAPLALTFRFHTSLIPAGEDESSLVMLRNGERLRNCTQLPPNAIRPLPACVSSRSLDGQTITMTVLAVAASTWNVAVDDTVPDAPTITAPADNATVTSSTVAFSGAAEAGSVVKLFEGNTLKGMATAAGDGAWSVSIPDVSNGSHTYTATATDEANNVSVPSTRTFTVNTAPPPPPPDTTKPRVTAFGPSGANKPPAVNAFAVFNERVNPSTVNAASFKLTTTIVKKVRGKNKRITVNVPAVVTYNATTNRATLNPRRNLTPGATYKATVSTQVKDLAGNQLAAGKTWTFKVKPRPRR